MRRTPHTAQNLDDEINDRLAPSAALLSQAHIAAERVLAIHAFYP